MHEIRCDACGTIGLRAKESVVPKGWWFIPTQPWVSGSLYFVTVCSKRCAEALWKPGPGRLWRYEIRSDPNSDGNDRYWIFDALHNRPLSGVLMTKQQASDTVDRLNYDLNRRVHEF